MENKSLALKYRAFRIVKDKTTFWYDITVWSSHDDDHNNDGCDGKAA